MNDIIEDYLLGNLSAEEKQTFEKELAINADLQKEVELHRILITEVQAFNAVQDAEAAYRAEQEQNSSAKVIVWNFKRIASIAACLLIVIGGYNVWLHQYTIGVGEDAYSVSCSIILLNSRVLSTFEFIKNSYLFANNTKLHYNI